MLTKISAAAANYQRDLGSGLILRWSTAEDTERIIQSASNVFREKEQDPPNPWITGWIQQLMCGEHPLMGQGDYALIEDTSKEGRPIVASTCFMRQDWEYEGIALRVGRPEIVACDPAYRRRGLIRALFELIHARSEAEGHLIQGITGIPYFYRQFGYEYALELDGSRSIHLNLIPGAPEGTTEIATLRKATLEDIPSISKIYPQRRGSGVVWPELPENYLRFYLQEKEQHPERARHQDYWMIVDTEGNAKGYLLCSQRRWSDTFLVSELEILAGVNLYTLLPALLRALKFKAEQAPVEKAETDPLRYLSFALDQQHPLFKVIDKAMLHVIEPAYAWYVRIADIPAFIQHIAPALEKRLAASLLVGYTGELKIDLYRSGLHMVFNNGKLTTVEAWEKPVYETNANAGFPPLVFLQLLLGHRSVEELRAIFPDVWTKHESELVLKVLFPARVSYVIPFN